MKKDNLHVLILMIVILTLTSCNLGSKDKMPPITQGEIRYVALGDSYTIGEGASEAESWPSVLTKNLQQAGVSIALVANPSATGWTTKNAIDRELPVFKNAQPTFATLLIGVNDYVQGVDENTFSERLNVLLDAMQEQVEQNVVLVTIPDFSRVPAAKYFGKPENIAQGLQSFNAIILKEATIRNLPVVDIFPLSQDLNKDPEMIAKDGLHPSAKAYAKWEKIIYPIVYQKIITS